MALNTFYKKVVTREEREECFRWFDEHMGRLPASFTIEAMDMPDLPTTVRHLLVSLRNHLDGNPTYNGLFAVLQLLRSKLIEQGIDS